MTDEDFNDLDLSGDNEEFESNQPPANDNRPFIIAAVVLGAILLLAAVGLGIVAFNNYQTRLAEVQEGQKIAQAATLEAEETAAVRETEAFAIFATETADAFVEPTVQLAAPTRTPVLAPAATTAVPVETQTYVAGQTATVAFLQTQVATQQGGTGPRQTTVARPTSTRLPSTGFADEVGMPGLFGVAVVLLAVIFLVRRLRTA